MRSGFKFMAMSCLTLFVIGSVSFPASTAEVPSEDQIKALIAQLGDQDHYIRAQAQKALEPHAKKLQKRLEDVSRKHKDAEVRWRARDILRLIPPPPPPPRTSPFQSIRARAPVKVLTDKQKKAAAAKQKIQEALEKAKLKLQEELSAFQLEPDPKAQKVPSLLSLTLSNTFTEPLNIQIKWDLEDHSPWGFAPALQKFTIPKAGTKKLEWEVTCKGTLTSPASLAPLPVAEINAKLKKDIILKAQRTPLKIQALTTLLGKYAPSLTVRKAKQAPAIDGQLDEAAWKGKPDIEKLFIGERMERPVVNTGIKLRYDETHLYISVLSEEPQQDKIRALAAGPDGQVWQDDSVELFLDTNLDHKTYYQIGINTEDVVADSSEGDSDWDGEVSVKTTQKENAWAMEISIPWKKLNLPGAPKKGKAIGFNIQRNRTQGKYACMQWAPTLTTSHRPEMFGKLLFE